MKTPASKIGIRLKDMAHDQSLPKETTNPMIDPDTGHPVVRDLRFQRFVAHQREFYFVNQHGGQ